MKYSLLAIMLILVAAPAHAGTVVCSGTVEDLSYHASNRVMIRLSSMNTYVFVCNPDAVWTVAGTSYTTGPETCKAMYATFLAARISGTPLRNVYFDGDQTPASCDAWANWSYANIRHYKL